MQLTSEIMAHQSVIRCVKTMHTDQSGLPVGDKIFATASDLRDKTVMVWDMTTNKSIAVLKGHKGDIRALEFSRDGKFLFSAGQGGMLVWDLKKLDQPLPIENVRKDMDIFSLHTTSTQLFIGCRNHSLLPMSLSYQYPFSEQVDPPPPSG